MSETQHESFIVKRDGDKALRFQGARLANVYNSGSTGHRFYSGSVGRSMELSLYKTAAGKYVCEAIGHTSWQGEHDRHNAEVCENLDGVFAFFEDCPHYLAVQLYENAGIEYVQDIA
jgi:hypothetical protein